MSNIGAVIGWKFNHQPGMSTRDGVITAFPGGIPSKELQDQWTAEYEAYLAAKPPEKTLDERVKALEIAADAAKIG